MKIKFQLPIKVHVDNKGVSSFLIEIECVQTEKNKSYIIIKNFSKDKHKYKFKDFVKDVNQ